MWLRYIVNMQDRSKGGKRRAAQAVNHPDTSEKPFGDMNTHKSAVCTWMLLLNLSSLPLLLYFITLSLLC